MPSRMVVIAALALWFMPSIPLAGDTAETEELRLVGSIFVFDYGKETKEVAFIYGAALPPAMLPSTRQNSTNVLRALGKTHEGV